MLVSSEENNNQNTNSVTEFYSSFENIIVWNEHTLIFYVSNCIGCVQHPLGFQKMRNLVWNSSGAFALINFIQIIIIIFDDSSNCVWENWNDWVNLVCIILNICMIFVCIGIGMGVVLLENIRNLKSVVNAIEIFDLRNRNV